MPKTIVHQPLRRSELSTTRARLFHNLDRSTSAAETPIRPTPLHRYVVSTNSHPNRSELSRTRMAFPITRTQQHTQISYMYLGRCRSGSLFSILAGEAGQPDLPADQRLEREASIQPLLEIYNIMRNIRSATLVPDPVKCAIIYCALISREPMVQLQIHLSELLKSKRLKHSS